VTVSEAIYCIVELQRMAARVEHDFVADERKLEGLGFSSTDIDAIFAGVECNRRVRSATSVKHS
jgi:hypothetical protein